MDVVDDGLGPVDGVEAFSNARNPCSVREPCLGPTVDTLTASIKNTQLRAEDGNSSTWESL